MVEKLSSADKNNLIFFIAIIALSVNAALARDHVIDHLTLAALIWSLGVIAQGGIRFDIGDVLIFSGMMLFMWMYRGWFLEGVSYGIMCTVIYQVGKQISEGVLNPANRGEYRDGIRIGGAERAMSMIIILACAFLARALLNYDYVIKWKHQSKVYGFRISLKHDIYGEAIERTEQAFYLVLMACLLMCFVFILVKKSAAVGLAGIILSCLAIRLDIYKKGRMVACCAVVTAAVVLIAAGIEKKLYKRRWIQITGAVISVLIIAFIACVYLDLFGLYDMYENSFWLRDGGVLGNVRFRIMKNAFTEMLNHPLTGSNEALFATSNDQISSMAHNSWLDIGMQSGILPFVLTVAFTVTNIISIFRVWKNCDDLYKYVLIAGFTGITLYNMFEPAILNYIVFWNTEVFLGGLANGACERRIILDGSLSESRI